LEDGPLQELEKSVAERKHLLAQSGQLLDKLVEDLGGARLELERREGAATASQKEQKALEERIKEVKTWELRARHVCQHVSMSGFGVLS